MLKNPNQEISKGSLKPVDLLCDYCGHEFNMAQRTRFNNFKDGVLVKKDACKQCRNKKREETSLIKYGTKIPSQSELVRKKSSLSKGGSGTSVTQYKDEIIKLHSVEGMSVNEISRIISIHSSVLFSYMKELGLDTRGDIVKKKQTTCLNKYGATNFLQSNEGKKRTKATLVKKYGSENPYENEEFKEKALGKTKATNLERYGHECVLQDPSRQHEFNKKRRNTRIKNGNEVSYNNKTAKELCGEIGINLSSFHERVRKVGIEKAISSNKHETYLELMFENWLKESKIDYIKQFCVGNKIVDFKISSVMVELDGLYWHSDAIERMKEEHGYHSKKRDLYITNGYTPLFFREDEINNKFDIIKSIVLNKLNKTPNIFYARKCTLSSCSKDFFKNNHLMGKGQGTIFSLEHNGDTVAAIQIKKINGKNYEISRFCTKLNTTVIGGFSRLVKQVERVLDMDSLKTFIDLRYGTGSYLEPMGFLPKKTYLSFKWTNGVDVIHRSKFPGNSGYDKGFFKIWDCGQAPFIKEYGV